MPLFSAPSDFLKPQGGLSVSGYHHLFVPGPTNVPDEILNAIHCPMEDYRGPQIPDFAIPLYEDVKKIFKSETGEIFIYPSSGTGGWEAAVENTLSPGDKVVMSQFGRFSYLWVDMCQRLGLDVVNLDVDWGEGAPPERYHELLEADKNHEIKAIFVCQNETATGVTSDCAAFGKILKDLNHPALYFVDGVSSIASIDFRTDEWGVDLAVAGSQKGFMLPPGLGIVCASQKAMEAHKNAKLKRCYFDFDDFAKTATEGIFPYTPETQMLRGLRKSVDMLLEEGLDNVFDRHYRLAEGLRRAVKEGWGLKVVAKEPKWESDTVSGIFVPEGFDARQVISLAFHRYKLSLGAGLMQLMGKAFRIGHLGALNELMLAGAITGAEMAMRDIGIDVAPGSGIAAASEYWRSTAKPVEIKTAASPSPRTK
jgi:alanine-glyoxylate transaminase/serine-glyoxylate transaminase/serine-pyruvate transaminase